MALIPHRDKFGRRVCIIRPGFWNPDQFKFPDLFCTIFQLYEVVAQEEKTQIAGCTGIVDAKNFGFKQLRNMALEDLRVVTNFIQVNLCIPEYFTKFISPYFNTRKNNKSISSGRRCV